MMIPVDDDDDDDSDVDEGIGDGDDDDDNVLRHFWDSSIFCSYVQGGV